MFWAMFFLLAAAAICKREMITPPMLAKRWGVSTCKIDAFIKSGELEAIDLSTRRGGRPRYAISEDAIARFERSRQVIPETPTTQRLRRKAATGITEYF